jgi:DNA repair protein RecN (Recombination protein N)
MLSQLHIENVAVIEKIDLELEAGFNVLTGETGAGKSILIDSINLVLGERTSKDIVRAGAPAAHVTALFTGISNEVAKQLAEFGLECEEDGTLLISRDISADGRGACRISGRPATVSMIRDIGRMLVNIHGQHDNQALMSPEKHIYYLDRYAGIEDLLQEYTALFGQMKQLARGLARVETDEAEKARRIDLLNYQIGEINSAAPKTGEDDELNSRKTLIQNAGKIADAVNSAYAGLCGGEDGGVGAQELVAAAAESLSGVTMYYPELETLSGRISSLSFELDDCVADLRMYTGETEYGAGDIDYIEQRLDTLYKLKLKYGGSIEKVLKHLSKAENDLEAIESSDIIAAKLSKQLSDARERAGKCAAAISEKRIAAAAGMEDRIRQELLFLEMPGVEFKVNITPLDELSENGMDNVEFLISANPGSPLKPLAKIASGGEISRIMLGIKTVLAGKDDIDTLIFDEIDAGVSGRAAQKIGMKLRDVARNRQVLCVTHLAQIAAQADRHVLIEKTVSDGKTFTSLKTLGFEGRKRELARIIGGAEITDITLQNTAEMLIKAGIFPKDQSGVNN